MKKEHLGPWTKKVMFLFFDFVVVFCFWFGVFVFIGFFVFWIRFWQVFLKWVSRTSNKGPNISQNKFSLGYLAKLTSLCKLNLKSSKVKMSSKK